MTPPPLSGWIDAALIGTACVALLVPAFHFFRVRPVLRHLAWLVVALRFLVPATPGWTWQPMGGRLDAWVGAYAPGVMPVSVQPTDDLPPGADAERGVVGSDEPTRIWVSVLAALWGLGALTVLVLRLSRYARWRRDVERGTAAPDWLEQEVRAVADRLELIEPRVVVSRHVRAPVVAGLRRPLLAWPAEMPVPLDAPARRAVVAHELAHLCRRDLWTGWIELLVAAVWWWYPPAVRVCRELSAAAEEACDRWVLSLYPEQWRSYAETLFAVAVASPGPTVPSLAYPLSAHAIMERRLEGIARDRRAPRTSLVERAMVLAGALIVLPAGVLTGNASPLAVHDGDVAGILGRGDARVTPDGAPVAEGEGWIVALRTNDGGDFRAVFAAAAGATALGATGEPTEVTAADHAWIRRVVRETRWSVEPGSGLSSSGALVPGGPHVHLTSEDWTVAVWSAVATPFDDQGRLGAEVTEARAVVAALWSTSERLRLFRFWRDERGRVRGEHYSADGRTRLANPTAVAAELHATLQSARSR